MSKSMPLSPFFFLSFTYAHLSLLSTSFEFNISISSGSFLTLNFTSIIHLPPNSGADPESAERNQEVHQATDVLVKGLIPAMVSREMIIMGDYVGW